MRKIPTEPLWTLRRPLFPGCSTYHADFGPMVPPIVDTINTINEPGGGYDGILADIGLMSILDARRNQ
jgi:hypothetical protein